LDDLFGFPFASSFRFDLGLERFAGGDDLTTQRGDYDQTKLPADLDMCPLTGAGYRSVGCIPVRKIFEYSGRASVGTCSRLSERYSWETELTRVGRTGVRPALLSIDPRDRLREKERSRVRLDVFD
jgi:hypothetical protein